MAERTMTPALYESTLGPVVWELFWGVDRHGHEVSWPAETLRAVELLRAFDSKALAGPFDVDPGEWRELVAATRAAIDAQAGIVKMHREQRLRAQVERDTGG